MLRWRIKYKWSTDYGLQARLREVEPRALYVHCNAHNLNLGVQDSLENVPCTRNDIGVTKDMINFVR